MTAYFASLPAWGQYLVQGLSICILMCFASVMLARMGRNPYWALLVVLPMQFLVIPLWFLAFTKWPAAKTVKKREN